MAAKSLRDQITAAGKERTEQLAERVAQPLLTADERRAALRVAAAAPPAADVAVGEGTVTVLTARADEVDVVEVEVDAAPDQDGDTADQVMSVVDAGEPEDSVGEPGSGKSGRRRRLRAIKPVGGEEVLAAVTQPRRVRSEDAVPVHVAVPLDRALRDALDDADRAALRTGHRRVNRAVIVELAVRQVTEQAPLVAAWAQRRPLDGRSSALQSEVGSGEHARMMLAYLDLPSPRPTVGALLAEAVRAVAAELVDALGGPEGTPPTNA